MSGPPDFDPAEWMAIDLEQWEIWPDGDENPDLRTAADEIAARTARILEVVTCGPCERTVARRFATSVGEVWRVHDPKDFVIDEIDRPAAPILCPVHGTDHLIHRTP